MSDKKDKDFPDPDELQKMLKDMFGKMGASVTMPGFSQGDMPAPSQGDSSGPSEVNRADEIFDFNYKPRDIKAHLDRFVIRQD